MALRTIDPAVLAAIEAQSASIVLLVDITYTYYDTADVLQTNVEYLCTSGQNITYDGNAYAGLGSLVTIGDVEESTELQGYQLGVTITGIDQEYLADILALKYQNNPIIVRLAALTDDAAVIDTAFVIFAGRMDNTTITMGKDATIDISCSSRLVDWETPRGGRYTQSYQQSYVDATDKAFEYVAQIAETEILWGTPPERGSTNLVQD